MKNKVLTEIYVPSVDERYNIYLPLNKNVAEIITLIGKSIGELKRIENINYNNFSLYNKDNGIVYSPEKLIRETNIRNGTRLIMM